MKKIGVLGGMGSQASLHFYEMLIQKSKGKVQILRNQDYPHIGLENIPVPDLIEDRGDLLITTTMVNHASKCLENAGADFLVMPCNTMHLLKREIMEGVNIPFISMIDYVIDQTLKLKIRRVGLIGSGTTMQSELYTSQLLNMGVKVDIPDIQNHHKISKTIQNYISGETNQNDVTLLEGYCNALIENGSEAIILGCTELPLILKDSFQKYNFLASSELLAEQTLKYSQT